MVFSLLPEGASPTRVTSIQGLCAHRSCNSPWIVIIIKPFNFFFRCFAEVLKIFEGPHIGTSGLSYTTNPPDNDTSVHVFPLTSRIKERDQYQGLRWAKLRLQRTSSMYFLSVPGLSDSEHVSNFSAKHWLPFCLVLPRCSCMLSYKIRWIDIDIPCLSLIVHSSRKEGWFCLQSGSLMPLGQNSGDIHVDDHIC